MILVGIDPGMKGAACAFDKASMAPLEIIDLPLIPDGRKSQLDVPYLCRWLHRLDASRVVIERTVPMPGLDGATGARTRGMGVSGAFRSGLLYGQLRALVEANGIPLTLVTPRLWKAHFELVGPDKNQDRLYAIAKFPEFEPQLRRKKDDGRADSILIAYWAALHLRGIEMGLI